MTSMDKDKDKDRASGNKRSHPVSKAARKKQQHPAKGVAIYYQVKRPKVGRPKKVDKIVHSMEKYFKQIEGDLNDNDNMLDDLMEVIDENLKNMHMK